MQTVGAPVQHAAVVADAVADGELVEGETHADESMLTGEALPVSKTPGDAVTGGSLNGEGSAHVRVRAVGAQSTLAQIIALVQEQAAA